MDAKPTATIDHAEAAARLGRQMELANKLTEDNPGLPQVTAIIMAGDLFSAEVATKMVNEGTPAIQAAKFVGSYARWGWIVTMVRSGHISDEWFAQNIADEWVSADPDDTDPAYLSLWKRMAYQNKGYIRDGRALPRVKGGSRTITVYRGGQDESVLKGFAWTTDPKVARKFASGAGLRIQVPAEQQVVVAGEVKPSHVLAYLTDRHEAEVIVDPQHVQGIRVVAS